MDKKDKTKVEIETEILNQLIKLKEVGDTYSDVIRRLLKKNKMKYSHTLKGGVSKN